jgi:hypothetical protein
VRIARPLLAALLAAPFAAPPAAHAQNQQPQPGQTYRCTGKDGKKYYGQSIPQPCIGQPMELLNKQGMVIKRFDPQATAAERAHREAEESERKKREVISKEEGRRNRALLATYTSEKDIEAARARALQENEAAVKEIDKRIALMKQKQADTRKEIAQAKEKSQPVGALERTITNFDFDIKTAEDLRATKAREAAAINARYDEDVKRYRELTKGTTK